MEHWGLRLRQALRSRRIRKLHALAVEIGVDQSAISRWSKGLAISLPNAMALCKALDVSLDWLLMGRGAMYAHRTLPADQFDAIAQIFFRDLTAREAAILQQTL